MWKLKIVFGDAPELEDTEGTFATIEECLIVLNKYMGYTKAIIKFVAFDDPTRY
jgi:hypothetical protein